MSSNWRRFEVLLPLQFNDGQDVPAEWLAEAVLEMVDQFGAASSVRQATRRRSSRATGVKAVLCTGTIWFD
jgi:hypothetical protein